MSRPLCVWVAEAQGREETCLQTSNNLEMAPGPPTCSQGLPAYPFPAPCDPFSGHANLPQRPWFLEHRPANPLLVAGLYMGSDKGVTPHSVPDPRVPAFETCLPRSACLGVCHGASVLCILLISSQGQYLLFKCMSFDCARGFAFGPISGALEGRIWGHGGGLALPAATGTTEGPRA